MRRSRFLAITIALLACAGILFVARDTFLALDTRVADFLYAQRADALLRIFYAITLSAESEVVIAFVLLVSAIFFLNRQRAFIFVLWLALIPSELVTYVGKLAFQRERPMLPLRAVTEGTFAFPSGHATTAVVIFGFLAYAFLRGRQSRTTTIASSAAAMLAVLLVDASRLYLGVHYATDVIAGNIVGLAGLTFAIGATEWLIARRGIREPLVLRPSQLAAMLLLLAALIGIASLVQPMT